MRKAIAMIVALIAPATVYAQSVPEATHAPGTPEPAEQAAPSAPVSAASPAQRIDFKVDPDVYSIVSGVRGLSTHKATYFFPATWSHDYEGKHTEMVFQISAKWSVFGTNAYLAYTQKSFWQWLDSSQSSPFRETNYNPEAFYRWQPDQKRWNYWGADIGIEHESDGQGYAQPVNLSRSWNRVYIAPFQAKGKGLAYFKFWYRIPEGKPSSPSNQNGDDNPDITDYMGYGEFTFSRQIGGDQLLTAMVRENPRTGHGAVQFTWSVPSREHYVFWGASVFSGYGESLTMYNEKITRVMFGIMLAR